MKTVEGKNGFANLLDKQFKLKERNTTVRMEIVAGTALFLGTVYNPMVTSSLLADAGMDRIAVFLACTYSLILGGLLYGLWTNYPFIAGPSIGVSPWIAYYVILQLGVPWQTAMACTFTSGVLFLILSFVGFREKVLNAIPRGLKYAFSGGIGAFITLVGLLNTGIVVTDPESFFGLSLGNLTSPATALAVLTFFIIAVLHVRKIKGSFLIGILFYTVAGIFIHNPATGTAITVLPSGNIFTAINPITALAPTFGKISFSIGLETLSGGWLTIILIIFTIFFIDVFDTVGTLAGLTSMTGHMDEEGNIPLVNRCFMIDAVGTVSGSLMGTSMVTTYADSAIGIAQGGKTGLTPVWAAFMYVLSLFFAPIFTIVPLAACGAAVAVTGPMMLTSVLKVNLNDFTELLPAFFCIFMMPFTGNMGVGILCGIFIFTILKTIKGKDARKDVTPILWVLSAVFVLYIFAQNYI